MTPLCVAQKAHSCLFILIILLLLFFYYYSVYFWETRVALALLAVTIMQIMYVLRVDRCVHCKAQSTHVYVYRYCKIEHLNSL